MLSAGLKISLNGDDPAYFFGHEDKYGTSYDGYIDSNYAATARECALSADELVKLALDSLDSSFAPKEEKLKYREAVRRYCQEFQYDE
mmetsp:Transcript_1869/g.5451  ORF Transcript_1869/g.5451 Transcript_1869/m.5451 type:complete len:88 (+) Transcript_1869:910-1173(+)